MATGFLEAVLSTSGQGSGLASLWADMGPKSRAYCLAWNDFTGVDSPGWMSRGVM
jgi:hypothetical protein